jgi:hypothetical protein
LSDPFHEGREAAKARRIRSMAIAGALLVFVVLIFVITLAKLSAGPAHG